LSVHGEYNRSLESLLSDVRKLDSNSTDAWVSALEESRSSQAPDLSTAASRCLAVLERIDTDRSLSNTSGVGPDLDPLREPFLHLRAHCRAILGISELDEGPS